MFLNGPRAATLHQLQPIDIHGTRYVDIAYELVGETGQVRTARLGAEDVYPAPQPGDEVQVRFVMNVAVGMTKR